MNRKPHVRASALALALATAALALPATAQNFSPWSAPIPASFNTAAAEGCPIEAPNGLSVYIASNRQVGYGKLDIWRAFRSSRASQWGPMENLGSPVNTGEFDYCPTPLNGRWLMYVTSQPTAEDCYPGDAPPAPPAVGAPAAGDMFLTQERPDGSWRAPLHLGCSPNGPNTAGAEFSPSIFEAGGGESFLYFSSNGYPDSQLQDIYESRVLADGTVMAGRRVAELSTSSDDRMPNVRKDGLEIVFSSNRPGSLGQDIHVATRASTSDAWNPPVRIADTSINTPAAETRASLSGDGTRLYFGRVVDPTIPGDVFYSTRQKLRRKQD